MLPTPFSITLFVKYCYGQSFWNNFLTFKLMKYNLGNISALQRRKKEEEKKKKKKKKREEKHPKKHKKNKNEKQKRG